MPSLDPIADPVRLAIARYLARHPASSAREVAAGAGVHLNTARAHLAALEGAGVAARLSERGQVGRPVVRYSLVDDWQPGGEALLGLSSLLASALLGLDADRDGLYELGRAWGRRWAGAAGSQPVAERLVSALRRLGFQARSREGRLELASCPCPLVAPESPALVCRLADAAVDGVLEGSGLAAESRDHEPRVRRCSVTLAAAAADAA